MDVEILEADYDYAEKDNTNPFILPPPTDMSFYAGEEFEYQIGNLYDAESNNQTIRISIDLGRAGDFARYEDSSQKIVVGEGATKGNDVGYYDIKIRVYDNFDEIEEDEK